MNSIATNPVFTQALSDLITAEVASSRVSECLPDETDNPAYEAAQNAAGTAWEAVCAIADAHAARNCAKP